MVYLNGVFSNIKSLFFRGEYKMKNIKLNVKGMHCSSCEMLIKSSLEDVGARNIIVSAKEGTVCCNLAKSVSEDDIKKIIRDEGFEV
jgi:copper chaperone CopZ